MRESSELDNTNILILHRSGCRTPWHCQISQPLAAFPLCVVFITSSHLHLPLKALSLLVKFWISLMLWLKFAQMRVCPLSHIHFALRGSNKTQLVFLTSTQSSAYFFSLNAGNKNGCPHTFFSHHLNHIFLVCEPIIQMCFVV